MAKKSYSELLKDPRWQKKRLEILERDNWLCKFCQDGETELQIHHLKYSGKPWEAESKNLITVCKHCHSVLELLKETESFSATSFSIKKYIGRNSKILIIAFDKDDKLIYFFDDFSSGNLAVQTVLKRNIFEEVYKWIEAITN